MEFLKDKIAVVTGGNSGIGFATAKEFKQQGARVIITGRRKAALEQAAAAIGVTGMVADQASVPDIESLVAAVKEKFGQIDILFINAGILGMSTIESSTEKVFDDVIDINFKGAFFTLARFIPLLKDGASVPGRVPLSRMGNTEDVAKMVAYLCGDYAGFITGAEILMDGGMALA